MHNYYLWLQYFVCVCVCVLPQNWCLNSIITDHMTFAQSDALKLMMSQYFKPLIAHLDVQY